VLEHSREPTFGFNTHWFVFYIDAFNYCACSSFESESFTGKRKTPFVFEFLIRGTGFDRRVGKGGVDNYATPRVIVIVGVAVYEYAQTNTDLRCRQPNPRSLVHGVKQVLDQLLELLIKDGHFRS
jgi:hypothetical protein